MTKTRSLALPLLVLALLAGAAACQNAYQPVCPTGSRNEGTFVAAFTPQTNPSNCTITTDADGGATDASLSTTPPSFNATVCSSPGVDGGAATVYMQLSSGLPRVSALGDGGTFVFTSSATVTGTACVCDIAVVETISGTLLPARLTDAGAEFDGDAGGFEPLRGFTSQVVDAVDGGPGCHCPMPCSILYELDGAR